MRHLLLAVVTAAATLAGLSTVGVSGAAAADADDQGLGQRCVVHLTVVGGEVNSRFQRRGQGDEWIREPLWRVRPGQSTTWEVRGRRGRGCQSQVVYEGNSDERFTITLNNPVEGAPTRRCAARGTGTFNCSVTKRPRTPRTVTIDVRIRFGRG